MSVKSYSSASWSTANALPGPLHHVGIGRERHHRPAGEPRRLRVGEVEGALAGQVEHGAPVVGAHARPARTSSVRTSPGHTDTTATPRSASSWAMSAVILSTAALPDPVRHRVRVLHRARRRDVHDEPAAAGEHQRHAEARGHVVRPRADVDDLVPRVERQLPERLAEVLREVERRVHVVHEHVEAAVLRRPPARTAPPPRRRRGGRTRPPHPCRRARSTSAAVSPTVPGSGCWPAATVRPVT